MAHEQSFDLTEAVQVDDPTDMVSYAVSKSADMVANTAIKSARLLSNNLARLDLRAGPPAWFRDPNRQAEEKLHPLVQRYWHLAMRIEGVTRELAKAEMNDEDYRLVSKLREVLQRYDIEANRLLAQMHDMTAKTAAGIMATKLKLLQTAAPPTPAAEDPKELITEMVGALVSMGIVPEDKRTDALSALGVDQG